MVLKIRFPSKGMLFLFMAVLLAFGLWSQKTGSKYFKNYSREEYGEHAQNWSVVQDERGVIYVGNNGGVLEFDGVTWRFIPIADNRPVRSMAIDETGTIYIGSTNEIGFLNVKPDRGVSYESLRKYLDDNNLYFEHVRRTHALQQKIYFRAEEFLFRWDSKRLKLWKPQYHFDSSFVCRGTLFIRDGKRGLMKIDGESLIPVPGGRTFANAEIFMMVPYDSQKILLATGARGCYLYDGTKFLPFKTDVDDYLREKKFYHGIRLSSGNYALATRKGGLVIIDSHGKLKQIFNKQSGLQNENVKYVFEDFQGNLWLGLDFGIAKIEYNSPLSLYDERSGLPKIVLSAARHRQDFYVGTTSGLYVLSPYASTFQPVPGMRSGCWFLLSVGDSLLAATDDGIMRVGNNNQSIIKDKSFVLYQSRKDMNHIWGGTDKGLVYLNLKYGQWEEEFRLEKDIKSQIRTIVEDRKGNLWLGPGAGGVFKIEFQEKVKSPVLTRYKESYGLPGGEVRVFRAAEHVMFATEKGIFRFDESTRRFIPDKTLGDTFANTDRVVFRIAEDKNRHIWLHSKSRNYQAIPKGDGTFLIDQDPFLRLPNVQANTIYLDGHTIWFGTSDNLIRFDTSHKKNYRLDFQTLIRRVVVNEESVIFEGNKGNDKTTSLLPIIDYRDRNLRFEFAALFFEGESSTRYQWLLEGYNDKWSEWGRETRAYYTNLDAGLYSFRVRAKNVYRHLSEEDIFQFKILPPWYNTWWAFSLYAAAAFLVVFFIVRWRSGKLERERQRLERIVKQRTKEINEKNRQLETQTSQLKEQSVKLQEMAKVKSRFFANISHEFRTPLTLIMGPVEQMLSLSRDRDKEEVKQLNGMLRNSQRLLTLINQLLDLSRFDSGKMKLQAARQDIVPFLKGILASFQVLTDHNKIHLVFAAETGAISLYFDAAKMEEVISNLLANAVKFTPEGGTITVSVKQIPGKGKGSPEGFLELSVSDTGKGIPKDQLGHIFDRFYKVEGGSQNFKGTGIGLALAKELVNLHQGNIDVHSTEGKGTTFIIRLPMGKAHLKADEIAASTIPSAQRKSQEILALSVMVEGEKEDGKVELETNSREMEPGAGEKDVILVVEDNAEVRKYIRDPLESFYTVKEAVNGKQGVETAREIIPDLIVSDIMMPEMDGYELCNVLKKDVRTSHVPIILLTAKASEESVIEGLETGADDYITKPFNTKILMTRIKNLIELRRQLQEKIQRQLLLQPAEISVSSVDQEFIKELQQMIEKNLSDPEFNVEALSKKLYMNRATLYRKIMALTGETPIQFIRSYRLKRAAQLLRDKFGNVSEVSLEVGFSNMAYFAKCFKEKFHQSPSTYQAAESH